MIKRKIRWDLLKYSLWTRVLKVTFFIHFYPATVNVTDTSCFLLSSNVYPKLIYKRAYIKLRGFFSMHSSFKYKQESISTVLLLLKGASPIFKDSNPNSKYTFYENITWKTICDSLQSILIYWNYHLHLPHFAQKMQEALTVLSFFIRYMWLWWLFSFRNLHREKRV